MSEKGICSRCNRSMYQCSNGMYECRAFDCPPGTEAKYHESWRLRKEYQPVLMAMPSGLFTVGELLEIHSAGAAKETGKRMRELYERASTFRRSSQNQTVSGGVEGAHEGTTADKSGDLLYVRGLLWKLRNTANGAEPAATSVSDSENPEKDSAASPELLPTQLPKEK